MANNKRPNNKYKIVDKDGKVYMKFMYYWTAKEFVTKLQRQYFKELKVEKIPQPTPFSFPQESSSLENEE